MFILSEAAGNVDIHLKYQVEGVCSHLRDDLQTNKHCAVDPLTRDKNKAKDNAFPKQYILIFVMHDTLHTIFDIVPSTLNLNGKIYKVASLGIYKTILVGDESFHRSLYEGPYLLRVKSGIANQKSCQKSLLNNMDFNKNLLTVYPKKYAHGFCFAVLWCGYTLTDFPISIRLTSLALWQSNDCPSASKVTLMNMDKYFMSIHYERLHNHNKAKHNKTVCIFLGIYCINPHFRMANRDAGHTNRLWGSVMCHLQSP